MEKKKGALIYNKSLSSSSLMKMKGLFLASFERKGVPLDVLYSGDILNEDARFFSSYGFFLFYDKDIALARRIEAARIPIFNSPSSIDICDSKIKTHFALMDANIPVIETLIAPLEFFPSPESASDYLKLAISRFGLPIIIKEEFGSLGQQVYKADTLEEASEILLKTKGKRILFQPYLDYREGEDIRVFVCGGQVVGAMKRNNPNDFRSNIENGGVAAPIALSPSLSSLAIKACKALGLDFAGVDIIEAKKGDFRIIEVNSNPHFIGLLQATGIDFSSYISSYILSLIQS